MKTKKIRAYGIFTIGGSFMFNIYQTKQLAIDNGWHKNNIKKINITRELSKGKRR